MNSALQIAAVIMMVYCLYKAKRAHHEQDDTWLTIWIMALWSWLLVFILLMVKSF